MIVLEPVSHPGLEPVGIKDTLFAIGRTEAPFDAYPAEIAGDLSRRHARLFCEHGAVYLADLGSKNGTTVNGAPVRQAITALRSGDLLGFGKSLSYRVRFEQAPCPPARPRPIGLTLVPERGGADLQAIVVTEFPFLISKADERFARYRVTSPTQVNYLSRRHAHVFVKGGELYIEDLGSTNGTFVNGVRLDEHAVALHDGDLLAFGGRHFVYRVALQLACAEADPTLTRIGAKPAPAADADKTTFVAAADSFLEIFCVEPGPAQDDTPQAPGPLQAPPEDEALSGPGGKAVLMIAGLYKAFGGKRRLDLRRVRNWSLAAIALVVAVAWALHGIGRDEREIEDLLADGAYVQAAARAAEALADDPANVSLAALNTEAVLKAGLPPWMAALKDGRLQQARGEVAAMRRQARANPELTALLAELDWIVDLKTFVAARGGAQAAIRNPEDGKRVEHLLKQWEEQNESHQRAFATISAHVPAYRDAYADALSDLRKLALARGQP